MNRLPFVIHSLKSNNAFKLIFSQTKENNSILRFTHSEAETQPLSENVSEKEHYNVVISGGGMVGFAMACALGRSSKLADQKILLLEQAPDKAWSLPSMYNNRVCALNKQTSNFFEKMGIWDHIISMRAQPVRKMQVWDSCSESMISFDSEVDEKIAHIVENDVILSAIKKQIPQHVDVQYELGVSSYSLPSTFDSTVEISLKNDKKITTDLLIGADGVRSLVRETMKSKYISWDYDQMAIVGTLKLSEETDNFTAWQRFLPSGPLALLPLSSTHSSLVWSTTKEKAKTLKAMCDEDFVDALNHAMWDEQNANSTVNEIHQKWVGVLNNLLPSCVGQGVRQLPPSVAEIVPGSRASFPLGLGHAVHYVSPRVALIGDAAHRVHPLAGQGVNLGFGDVNCLLKILEDSVFTGKEIGESRELYKYESKRQLHNVSVMGTIDILHKLYSTNLTPVVLLRSLGLSTVNSMEMLKKQMIGYANS